MKKFLFRWLTPLFVVLSLAQAGKASAIPGVELEPKIDRNQLSEQCKNFIDKVLPENNWAGGFIRAPEDWKNPKGKSITIFYYHNTISSNPKPILFLNGGPFASYQNRMDALNKQLLKYDNPEAPHTFVMMDQRGTGCSTPHLPENSDINLQQYKHYGSPAIVQDAEMIRKKLFGDLPWKIMSQSFGGYLTSRYIQYFPNSVSEVHTYAPALYEKMSDFFMFRAQAQNKVMRKFLDHYPDDRPKLEAALAKISSDVGQNYCIPLSLAPFKACGRSLVDAMAGTIGQGYGRSLGSTEVWDGVKANLLALYESDITNPDDPNLKKFLESAKSAGSFFFKPTIAVVYSLWMQDTKFESGNLVDECNKAHLKLADEKTKPEDYLLDECRLIPTMVPHEIRAALKNQYKEIRNRDYITQKRLAKLILRKPGLKYYLYTGSLDSIVQYQSMTHLIESGAVDYQNFENSGHAGWLYEPLFWHRLLK